MIRLGRRGKPHFNSPRDSHFYKRASHVDNNHKSFKPIMKGISGFTLGWRTNLWLPTPSPTFLHHDSEGVGSTRCRCSIRSWSFNQCRFHIPDIPTADICRSFKPRCTNGGEATRWNTIHANVQHKHTAILWYFAFWPCGCSTSSPFWRPLGMTPLWRI